MMKKLLILIVAPLLLSSCQSYQTITTMNSRYGSARSLDDKYSFLIDGAESDFYGSDKSKMVSSELDRYQSSGGVIDDEFKSGLVNQCFNFGFPRGAGCVIDNIGNFTRGELGKREHRQEVQNRVMQENQRCAQTPGCERDKEIASIKEHLNLVYQQALFSQQYNQGEADTAIRQTCITGGDAQRSGRTLEELTHAYNQVPGLSIMARQLMRSTAQDCWQLSKLGVHDGTELIVAY